MGLIGHGPNGYMEGHEARFNQSIINLTDFLHLWLLKRDLVTGS